MFYLSLVCSVHFVGYDRWKMYPLVVWDTNYSNLDRFLPRGPNPGLGAMWMVYTQTLPNRDILTMLLQTWTHTLPTTKYCVRTAASKTINNWFLRSSILNSVRSRQEFIQILDCCAKIIFIYSLFMYIHNVSFLNVITSCHHILPFSSYHPICLKLHSLWD